MIWVRFPAHQRFLPFSSVKLAHFIPQVVALAVVGCGGGGNSPPKPPEPPTEVECTASLQWVMPTERMDETPLTPGELEKLTIYVMESPEPRDELFLLIIEVTDVNLISWEIQDLELRDLYFSVRVTDTEGRESAHSNVEGKDCTVD